MRWNTYAPKGEQPWVKWFAWRPTRVGFKGDCAWLEWLERRKSYGSPYSKEYGYLYRFSEEK